MWKVSRVSSHAESVSSGHSWAEPSSIRCSYPEIRLIEELRRQSGQSRFLRARDVLEHAVEHGRQRFALALRAQVAEVATDGLRVLGSRVFDSLAVLVQPMRSRHRALSRRLCLTRQQKSLS